MSQTRQAQAIRNAVITRAEARCEYCLTQILISGQAMQIDHIIPESLGGTSNLDNLCLACIQCNLHKSDRVQGFDAESGTAAPLFDPRTQPWSDHFRWVDDIVIEGITPTGRVTADLLNMNNSIIVNARIVWVRYGLHPP